MGVAWFAAGCVAGVAITVLLAALYGGARAQETQDEG